MARVDSKWIKKGTHLIPTDNVPIVLVNDYLNFGGGEPGESGYGIRNNLGVIQVKNESGSWVNINEAAIWGNITGDINNQTDLTERIASEAFINAIIFG